MPFKRCVRGEPEQVVHPRGVTRPHRGVGVRASRGDVVALLAPLAPAHARAVGARGARRDVRLEPDNGLDTSGFGLRPELVRTKQVAVVGGGDGRLTQPCRLLHQLGDSRRAVQHGVLRVDVQVHEFLARHAPILGTGDPRNNRGARRRAMPLEECTSDHHFLPAGAARQRQARGHRRRDPRQPGGHRLWRDRIGQDHPAPKDRARAGPRTHRPHPAPPYRRARRCRTHRRRTGHGARRHRGIPGAIHGSLLEGDPTEDHDRRHPAGPDSA